MLLQLTVFVSAVAECIPHDRNNRLVTFVNGISALLVKPIRHLLGYVKPLASAPIDISYITAIGLIVLLGEILPDVAVWSDRLVP